MNSIETAAGPRTFGIFPAEWGNPPSDPDRRAQWIAWQVTKRIGRTVHPLTADAERRTAEHEQVGRQSVKRLAHLMSVAESP